MLRGEELNRYLREYRGTAQLRDVPVPVPCTLAFDVTTGLSTGIFPMHHVLLTVVSRF
jgi:hypothetical protein